MKVRETLIRLAGKKHITFILKNGRIEMKITSRSVDESLPSPVHKSNEKTGGYFDNVNPTILQLIDSKMLKICEFGCGGGALAAAVRAKNTEEIYYVGLEIDDAAIQRAKPHLDLAIQCNLDLIPTWEDNEVISKSLSDNYFDCVIFGDVLEHLREPENVLRQAVSKLKPGGAVIVCIPNVQHWSVFANLILGSWPQVDSGIFDRTHIRWFTLRDMVDLFNRVNLTIENSVGRVFDAENGQIVIDQLSGLARVLGADMKAVREQCLPLQYVLVGRKANHQ
jgi:2-polyprenyl-3-methyl-5-hydroxy-6-metoxy-1,4-benzoquinol methylase